jgi:hypothetical protein
VDRAASPTGDGLGALTALAAIRVWLTDGVVVVSPDGELDLSNRDTTPQTLAATSSPRGWDGMSETAVTSSRQRTPKVFGLAGTA